VERTADFLVRHTHCIDRVMVNRFSVIPGTPVYQRLAHSPEAFPAIRSLQLDHRHAVLRHVNEEASHPSYRRAAFRVLEAAHAINRRPARSTGGQFDGIM
jgi:anaerobic magnesium-protoporphyrin IX monomethyl ester cyclase